MTPEELAKYVKERFEKGMTMKAIAATLGVSEEYLYRKMAENDDK